MTGPEHYLAAERFQEHARAMAAVSWLSSCMGRVAGRWQTG